MAGLDLASVIFDLQTKTHVHYTERADGHLKTIHTLQDKLGTLVSFLEKVHEKKGREGKEIVFTTDEERALIDEVRRVTSSPDRESSLIPLHTYRWKAKELDGLIEGVRHEISAAQQEVSTPMSYLTEALDEKRQVLDTCKKLIERLIALSDQIVQRTRA
jgi:hypothetical protein